MVNLKQSKPLLIDTPFEQWQLDRTALLSGMKQIREWIYEKGILDFEEMSNLSLGLREDLKKEWDLTPME